MDILRDIALLHRCIYSDDGGELMSIASWKFIDYAKWCANCVYADMDEVEDPCNECLVHPMRINDSAPLYFQPHKGQSKPVDLDKLAKKVFK